MFIGIGGLVSGAMLIADARGGMGMGLGALEGSPFKDFVIPGMILLVAVGVFPLVAAGAAIARARWAVVDAGHESQVAEGLMKLELPAMPPSQALGRRRNIMETKRFIHYQEGDLLVGWLEEYPDYRTQGETLDELKKDLQEIYSELTSGQIPCVHKVGELIVV